MASFASLRGRLRKAAVPAALSGRSVTGSAALRGGPNLFSAPSGSNVPDEVRDVLDSEGMDNSAPFAPGRPIDPFWAYGSPPRAWDYPTGWNLTTRARSIPSRMSFDTMKALLANYDVSRMCIEHRLDEIRALDHVIIPERGTTGDVSDAVAAGYKAMRKPDGSTPFDSWQNSFLEDVLRYDSGALYRGRLRNGTVAALEVVDGTTLGPMLDYRGRKPSGDAPAYVQFIRGVPGMWLTDNAMVYQPFRLQPDSPYGMPPIEWLVLTANTDIRHQAHFLNFFTEGTLPAAFAEAPPEYAHPDQIAELQAAWDQVMEGDQAMKRKMRWVPAGSKITTIRDEAFDHTFPEWLLKKACAGYKVKPSELGFTDDVNRSTGDVQSEVQARISRRPLMQYLERIYTGYLRDDLGLPVVFRFQMLEEREDKLQEAGAHKLYVEMGAESVDEVRENVLGLAVDHRAPTPRFIATRTGIVPLNSLISVGGPAIDPMTLAPQPGSVSYHDEDEPGLAALSGQETKISDLIGDHKRPEPAQVGLDQGEPAAIPAVTASDMEAAAGAVTPVELPADSDIVKELRAFTRFAKARDGRTWRDFTFDQVPDKYADLLNTAGRYDPQAAVDQARALIGEK